jgi:predicted MPP superfamily phosphohydrolase
LKKNIINKRNFKLACLFLALIIVSGVFIICDNFNIRTTEYTVENNAIPTDFNKFKILQISDLHNTNFGENNENLLNLINKEKPDVVFITGDSIDRINTDIEVPIKLCENILKICDVYFVAGNHELYADPTMSEEFIETLENIGVHVLKDSDAYIERNGEKIQIIGLADADNYKINYGENFKQDVINTIKNTDDSDCFTIVLSHHPELFPEYKNTDIDLVFSGHAHGGQFRIPLIGGVVAPEQGLFPEYDAGVFTENNTTMIVSRGLGNSIIPVRINNPPEIVIVTLKNSD